MVMECVFRFYGISERGSIAEGITGLYGTRDMRTMSSHIGDQRNGQPWHSAVL